MRIPSVHSLTLRKTLVHKRCKRNVKLTSLQADERRLSKGSLLIILFGNKRFCLKLNTASPSDGLSCADGDDVGDGHAIPAAELVSDRMRAELNRGGGRFGAGDGERRKRKGCGAHHQTGKELFRAALRFARFPAEAPPRMPPRRAKQ